MNLVIKNLVCGCCVAYVQDLLDQMEIKYERVSADGIDLSSNITLQKLDALDAALKIVDMEIVHVRKNMIVENIKSMVYDLFSEDGDPMKVNLSVYLSAALNYNYCYLSNLFSEAEGMTIREYVIGLRIARVKQMLMVEQLDLLEITCRMHYSSVSHLASQFKKFTGLTTTEFKRRTRVAAALNQMIA